MKLTLEELREARPTKITVSTAASIMKISPNKLRKEMQNDKYPFGAAVKFKRWVYYINTNRFLLYMDGNLL